jgi:hypothetical protein
MEGVTIRLDGGDDQLELDKGEEGIGKGTVNERRMRP